MNRSAFAFILAFSIPESAVAVVAFCPEEGNWLIL